MCSGLKDQLMAWVYVLTGCIMVIISPHFKVASDIGAGIIGAGINAFTQIQNSTEKKSQGE